MEIFYGKLFIGLALFVVIIHLVPTQYLSSITSWLKNNEFVLLECDEIFAPLYPRWGMYSMAQKFVRVVAEDRKTGQRYSAVLKIGNILIGTLITQVAEYDRVALPPDGQG